MACIIYPKGYKIQVKLILLYFFSLRTRGIFIRKKNHKTLILSNQQHDFSKLYFFGIFRALCKTFLWSCYHQTKIDLFVQDTLICQMHCIHNYSFQIADDACRYTNVYWYSFYIFLNKSFDKNLGQFISCPKRNWWFV